MATLFLLSFTLAVFFAALGVRLLVRSSRHQAHPAQAGPAESPAAPTGMEEDRAMQDLAATFLKNALASAPPELLTRIEQIEHGSASRAAPKSTETVQTGQGSGASVVGRVDGSVFRLDGQQQVTYGEAASWRSRSGAPGIRKETVERLLAELHGSVDENQERELRELLSKFKVS